MASADVFESDPRATWSPTSCARAPRELLDGREADADAVAEDLGAIVGVDAGGEATDRDALFHSVRDFLEGAARERPTILVFEDVHWAGASLLDLILALAARMRDAPALLLTLARPELLDTRAGLGRRRAGATRR